MLGRVHCRLEEALALGEPGVEAVVGTTVVNADHRSSHASGSSAPTRPPMSSTSTEVETTSEEVSGTDWKARGSASG